MILVTKPYIPNLKKYTRYISEVNDREWLTNFGPLHQELTTRLEEYLGVENLLLVSNGTLALQVAYRALGLRGDVITTPFSFVATSSSLVWEGLTPKYIDIDPEKLSLDPSLLPARPAKTISGVQAVHVYGNPADTTSLDQYCKDHNLKMVYDGAHAFGINIKSKSVLLAGDASTLSFHATKVFHTVEGGAVIFKDKKIFQLAKQMINFGYDDSKEIKSVGLNSKLNEYQAAVGLVLLDEIDKIIEKRSDILHYYQMKLAGKVQFPIWSKDATQNGAYAPILLESEKEVLQVMQGLQKVGIQTRRYFHPSLNKAKGLGENGLCPVSESVSDRVLCLPMYTSLTKPEQIKVISELLKLI